MISTELLQHIRQLTATDKKTLAQKVLKVGDEFGDLAKMALSYEYLPGARNTFTTRDNVAEEAADVLICALSVLYDIGITDDELSDWIRAKTTKWAAKQHLEAPTSAPIPYEIHVTVSLSTQDLAAELDRFTKFCKLNDIKPVILDLYNSKSTINTIESDNIDVMTSSTHLGSNVSVREYAEYVVDALAGNSFRIVRTKIETVPWHPMAPTKENSMPAHAYFEAHIPILVHQDDDHQLQQLYALPLFQQSGTRLSRNVLKRLENGNRVIMATYRTYDQSRDSFERHTVSLISQLNDAGFATKPPHCEFALYDSNNQHDAKWLYQT